MIKPTKPCNKSLKGGGVYELEFYEALGHYSTVYRKPTPIDGLKRHLVTGLNLQNITS